MDEATWKELDQERFRLAEHVACQHAGEYHEVFPQVMKALVLVPPDGLAWQHAGQIHDFKYAKLISAKFADSVLTERVSWQALLGTAHIVALRHFEYDELKRRSKANIRQGRCEAHAWKYTGEGDISIQHVEASKCWCLAAELATAIDERIEVIVTWWGPKPRKGKTELFVFDPAIQQHVCSPL